MVDFSHRKAVLAAEEAPKILVCEAGIPAALKELPRWINWRWNWNGKKWDKIPCCKWTDSASWKRFPDAMAARQNEELGMGFVLDDIVGVDLDDCRHPETGKLDDWAEELIQSLGSYAEVSPSGTGVKVFIRGDLPDQFGKRFPHPSGRGEVEIYRTGRYFTVTGQHLEGTPADVMENPEGLLNVCRDVQGWKISERLPACVVATHAVPDDHETALAALSALDPDMPYDDWLKVGMALHSVDSSSAMLSEWDRWSARGTKHQPREPEAKWKSFSGDGVALGTLIHMANATGKRWRPASATTSAISLRPRQKSNSTPGAGASVAAPSPVEAFRPFPLESLPEPIRGFVRVGSKAVGCDPSFLAVPLLVASAAAIGNCRRVRLKHGWLEPPILWAAIIAESGGHKSPALSLALRPLQKIQSRALKDYQTRYETWRTVDQPRYEKELAEWRKAKNSGGNPPIPPDEPIAWRIIVNDATIEALAGLLQNQPRGLLLTADELAAWLGSFERYKGKGGGGDAARWLEVHNGGHLMVDRKTGHPKVLSIPSAAVSVVGGIQPGILRRMMTVEHQESGMAARLLLSYPPRKAKRWTEAEVSPKAEEAMTLLLERLLSLKMPPAPDGEPAPLIIGLSEQAKTLFVDFVNDHAVEQSTLTGVLAATWSKLEAYAARFALVHYCIRRAAGDGSAAREDEIDDHSMMAGITLARWFGYEARRVHALSSETDEQRQTRELLDWVGRHGGRVTVRDLQHGGPADFRSSSAVADEALSGLVAAGLGRWETTETAGRPRTEFVLASDTTAEFQPETGTSVAVADEDHPEIRISERLLSESEVDRISNAFEVEEWGP